MPHTILSVDGSDSDRHARSLALRRAGFAVVEAGNGADAPALASQVQPSLVLLGIHDAEGFALSRRLKADPLTSHIPVLHVFAMDQAEAPESEADGCLREPVAPEALVAAVTASIWARAAARERDARQLAEERLRQTQKRESVGVLAAAVAHDFNNLLVVVIGNASLAQELLPPDSPAAGLLDGIVKAGEQAAHLTRQMLAYSGKGKFLVEAVHLSDLITEISALVQPSIPKKIALRLDLQANLPPIEADRGQMQQVFTNLALNAVEAIGGDDGLIAVKTSVQDVDEQYTRRHPEAAELPPGPYICLEVRDTGCGMDDATKARIFDPFFSTKFTGRGLGLAAVAGIVRGHKGAIMVTSAPGEGACFRVLFPATGPTGINSTRSRADAQPLLRDGDGFHLTQFLPQAGGCIRIVGQQDEVAAAARARQLRSGDVRPHARQKVVDGSVGGVRIEDLVQSPVPVEQLAQVAPLAVAHGESHFHGQRLDAVQRLHGRSLAREVACHHLPQQILGHALKPGVVERQPL